MQSKSSKIEPPSHLASFINGVMNDFNSLTSALKSPSRVASQTNHNLKNKLLLASQGEGKIVVRQILSHLLRIAQIKGVHNIVLSILGKVVGFVKVLQKMEAKQSLPERNQQLGLILSSIIDIAALMKNHYKQVEITLRIIQATFSTIDQKLLQFANYNTLTRVYSVCFECCESNQMIQNISVSALYSLTQIVFSSQNTKGSSVILEQMLEYLFNGKKFLWIKDKDLTGMVWDLVNIAIKSFPKERLDELFSIKEVAILLVKMYNLSAEKAFAQSQDAQKSISLNKSFSKEQNERSINFKKGYFPDFIRYYKTFIYFSVYLYFRNENNDTREIIPFRENFHLLKTLYETARNSKLYLLLEGVSLLLNENSYILIEEQQGIVLLDVFNKVCEELDHSQRPLQFNTDKGQLYLEKLCGDFNKISDNQFATIIKNTILRLRRNMQNENHELRQNKVLEQKSILENSVEQQQKRPNASLKKKWERLIKIVLKIIKHLTSLNLKEGSNDQIVRKLVGQLQYWIIICPTNKLKNLILQELLLTSTHLDSQIQSIKASQCLQIGSNIIYGYYDSLDTFGLAVILRMIAGTQISWQEGKGFDELEEVCIMTEKLYTEQQLVHSQQSFKKTIQAFALCLNGLLADCEQPSKGDSKQAKNNRKHIDRYHRMICYVLTKIESILRQSSQYIEKQWDFLTGLWISLASNKNVEIRKDILNHLLPIIVFILKKTHLSQESIILLYQQLAKLSSIQISKTIIAHLKQILLSLSSQNAILQTFKTLSLILQTKGIEIIHQQLYQFLQTIIKQSLFQVKSLSILINIIDHVNFIGKDKSQEYKVVNLIWHISDHLKTLKENHEDEESKQAWMHLFRKIIRLAETTNNGETKQSCIHAFTQIIAESVKIIDEPLFLAILGKQYLEIFAILMEFTKLKERNNEVETNNSQSAQANKQVSVVLARTLNIDMIRNGIKNFIRITRKCLPINLQASRSMFMEALSGIKVQLSEKKANTIEYLVEINALLMYFQEILPLEQYKPLNLKNQITSLFTYIQNNHQLVDKTTYTWKKYKTAFEEIKESILSA